MIAPIKGILQFAISRVLHASGSATPLQTPTVAVVVVLTREHELQKTGHVVLASSPKRGWLQSLDTNELHIVGSSLPWQVGVVVDDVVVVAVAVVSVVSVATVFETVVSIVVVGVAFVAVLVVRVVNVNVAVVLDALVVVDDDVPLVVPAHVLHSARHVACSTGPNTGLSQKKPARRSHWGGSKTPLHAPVVVVVVDVVVEAVVTLDVVVVVVVTLVLVSVFVVVVFVLVVLVDVVNVNVDVVRTQEPHRTRHVCLTESA